MKNKNILCSGLRFSALALALLNTQWVAAQDTSNWYLGASVGPIRATIDDDAILKNLGVGGFPNATISDKDHDTGYKIFSGYQFNRNFALEGSYFDLGEFGFMARSGPNYSLAGEMRLRGVGLDAVLTAPLTDKFSLFGKVGGQYSEARDTFAGTGGLIARDPNPNSSELNLKLGVGMQYAFSDALAIRTELERYRVNDAVGGHGDIDHWSVGLVYSWGRTSKPLPQVVTQPLPVAQAVMPEVIVATPVLEPTPAPKAVAPIPVKVTLSADSLFAFDDSKVSASGKQQLDDFASNLKTLDYEFVTVTGHTDRIGEHEYNMKLSTRRAQAVGKYLVQVSGIPEAKVLARGQGGANQLTKPQDCVGTKATKALIACLQPDRRVDLEVTGTR